MSETRSYCAGGYQVDQSDIDLEELVTPGKGQGYLTYDQVNEYLPDEAVNPDKLDSLLVALDDPGISLFNEPPRSRCDRSGGAKQRDQHSCGGARLEDEAHARRSRAADRDG